MEKLDNYITIPRQIASDRKNGKITPAEFALYMWLRVNLNPYGIVTVNIQGLKDDLFPNVQPGYINKLLRQLLKKQYIYYDERTGRRGSFEVHMGDLRLPSKQIKTLDGYFSRRSVSGKEEAEVGVGSSLVDSSRRSNSENGQLNQGIAAHLAAGLVAGSNNDNLHEHEQISIDKNSISVTDFVPKTSEEFRCKEIAVALGEADMRFILSALKDVGLAAVEQSFGVVKESMNAGTCNDPGRLFNYHIQKHKANIGGK